MILLDFLAVHWLRLCVSNAWGTGSIPGHGTKIPHAVWYSHKIKKHKNLLEENTGRTLLT